VGTARRFTHADCQRLERAVEHYLRDCYRKRTAARVSEFASFLGRTQQYLSRIAPEIVGMPLRAFLRRHQLDHAAELLRATPLRIEDIALASAFGTRSTFQRRFRAAFGMTPQRYREVTKCGMPDGEGEPILDLHPDRTLELPKTSTGARKL
jgi:AraC-like DNA-binding protein